MPLRSAVYLMDPKGEYVKFFGRISEAEGAASFLPLGAHWLGASVSCREGRSVSPPMRALRSVRICCPTLVRHLRVHRAAPLIENDLLFKRVLNGTGTTETTSSSIPQSKT